MQLDFTLQFAALHAHGSTLLRAYTCLCEPPAHGVAVFPAEGAISDDHIFIWQSHGRARATWQASAPSFSSLWGDNDTGAGSIYSLARPTIDGELPKEVALMGSEIARTDTESGKETKRKGTDGSDPDMLFWWER